MSQAFFLDLEERIEILRGAKWMWDLISLARLFPYDWKSYLATMQNGRTRRTIDWALWHGFTPSLFPPPPSHWNNHKLRDFYRRRILVEVQNLKAGSTQKKVLLDSLKLLLPEPSATSSKPTKKRT